MTHSVGHFQHVCDYVTVYRKCLFGFKRTVNGVNSELIVQINAFLPERDYVTFGSLLSQIRLSVACRLSVTLVHPNQGVEPFGKISSPLCTLAIL